MEKKEHIYVAMIISFLAVLLYSFINLYLAPLITNTVGIGLTVCISSEKFCILCRYCYGSIEFICC